MLQYELSAVVDDLSKSLHDIGFIRSLIRNTLGARFNTIAYSILKVSWKYTK